MPYHLTDRDKQRLGLFLVAYTAVFLAFYLTQDTELAKYGLDGRPLTTAAPAPTPLDLIRGQNDTCATFTNITDKRQHIFCNLRWQLPSEYVQVPGFRKFLSRGYGQTALYDVTMPHFHHGIPEQGLSSWLSCGMFGFTRGWPPVRQACQDPQYLYDNRPCNGLQWDATAEQVGHLLTYGWYRDVVQSEWEHYGNVTGVRSWQVYVTCSL